MLGRIYAVENTDVPAGHTINVPVTMALSSLRQTSGFWAVEPRSLGTGILTAGTLMRNEGRRSAVQMMNVGERNFVLRHGEYIGEAEQITTVDSDQTTSRPPKGEDVFSEEAAIPTGRPVEEADLKESCDDAQIQVMIDDLPPELDLDQRTAVQKFIRDRAGQFSKSEYDIGRTNLVHHVIDTGMHRPFKQPLRRHPLAHLEIIDKHVSEMLQNDIIEPAASPWASNVVLVREVNGQLRVCMDYRQLNLQTYKDSYSLPRIETCLDSLGGSKFFSSLDIRSRYWQAAIHPESADETAMVTKKGTFRFKVLSFGLTNAPALFQMLMNLVVAGLTWEVCLVYLDDVIVIADTFERHLERLKLVMDRLQRAGLKLNPAKCKLFQIKTKFLLHVVSGRGIEPDTEKVRAVVDWPTSRNLTEARGFVALASYYRRFVGSFAEIARPLHYLTQKQVVHLVEHSTRSIRTSKTLFSQRSCHFLATKAVTCLTPTPVTKRWVWFFNRNRTAC